jgi:hypothetical protein
MFLNVLVSPRTPAVASKIPALIDARASQRRIGR